MNATPGQDFTELAKSETTPEGKNRSNNFHVIRYVLAVCVLYSHSYGLLLLPEPIAFQRTFGTFAVQGFFAMSGYLIAQSCDRISHLGHYFANRTLRIAPALIIALALSHYLLGAFDRFITNPVPYIVNGPVWTLSWEVLCYILCGLLWRFGLLTAGALGSIVAAGWVMFVVMPGVGDTSQVIAPLFLLFFTGSYIALQEQRLNLRTVGVAAMLVLIVLTVDTTSVMIRSIIEGVPFLYGPNFSLSRHYLIVYLLCLPFALLWLARCVRPLLSLRNDYSYGMYIFGWPVQQSLIAFFPHVSPLLLFVVALAVTHGVAMMSWHLVEKRALRLKF